jgi:hypothetical protein
MTTEPAIPLTRPRMSIETALHLVGPLQPAWTAYTSAPIGDVSREWAHLQAAMILHEAGLAVLAQSRTRVGTEYLIKARRGT